MTVQAAEAMEDGEAEYQDDSGPDASGGYEKGRTYPICHESERREQER